VSQPHPASMQAATDSPGQVLGGSGRTGVLVVGHGTADPVGAEETRAVARQAGALLPETSVELGFLEVIGPSIADAMRELAGRGCRQVVVAPLLLLTAGHARRDVPEAVVDAAGQHGIVVVQAAALGCHSDMVALSQQRRREALAEKSAMPAEETIVVMLGRGSSAADGVAQFREWTVASLAGDHAVHPDFEIGFAAAARPTLDEALEAAAARRPRRVVVQPHLLFRGHVEQQVTAAVSRWQARCPEIDWVPVARLGADCHVAAALVSRARDAAGMAIDVPAPFSAEKNLSPEAG
jgi:sirohydrochlorin cobaltochelatase